MKTSASSPPAHIRQVLQFYYYIVMVAMSFSRARAFATTRPTAFLRTVLSSNQRIIICGTRSSSRSTIPPRGIRTMTYINNQHGMMPTTISGSTRLRYSCSSSSNTVVGRGGNNPSRPLSASSSLYSSPSSASSSTTTTTPSPSSAATTQILNLSTVTLDDLEQVIVKLWGYPKYRATQVYHWVRKQGITDVSQMSNLPQSLRLQLLQHSTPTSLQLVHEQISKDGTIKRAYQCYDNQLIESVLMPYEDGRYTACISSQAGCAQGCVFCATGQMGFARQLSCDEIVEQVSRFASELQLQNERLSNVVFMGMGEPLANYRQVMAAIHQINSDLGIGARKITISTVGIVPNIKKLYQDPTVPQVRLAVSLHCATDEERSALLPANRRYGGLDTLMTTLREYMEVTGRRITLEWALIENQNDSVETARQLGQLIRQYQLRRDMVHINVIPLNPTGGYGGSPSQRQRVNAFCQVLDKDFGIACTPRVRRGIDIDAGCGQLKSKVLLRASNVSTATTPSGPSTAAQQPASVGVYDGQGNDDDEELESTEKIAEVHVGEELAAMDSLVEPSFQVDEAAIDLDNDDDFDEYEDPQFNSDSERDEAARLIALVQGTTPIAARKDGKPTGV